VQNQFSKDDVHFVRRLELIQLLLGDASVQTTERYLGTKQDLAHVPNDEIKLRVTV
jgi:hypothetical protein